jgi:hypothetical protein
MLMSRAILRKFIQVAKALEARPHVMDGHRLASTYGDRLLAGYHKVRLYKLAPRTTDDALYSYFSQLGKPVHCIVKRDSDKRSRGFGFVEFSSREEVRECMIVCRCKCS